MTMHVSVEGRNAQLNALLEMTNGGSIEIRTGVQPTSTTGEDGFTLVVLPRNDPAVEAAGNGSADLNVSTPITASATSAGTATWARVFDQNGEPVMDGSVGTGSSDFTINSTSLSVDQPVNLLGGAVSLPA